MQCTAMHKLLYLLTAGLKACQGSCSSWQLSHSVLQQYTCSWLSKSFPMMLTLSWGCWSHWLPHHPCLDVGSHAWGSPHMLLHKDILPDCREKAIFGPAKQTSSDEVFAAIKRTFQTLDDEIIKEATSCDIADCQFGGSTAVIALRIGHVSTVSSALVCITAPQGSEAAARSKCHQNPCECFGLNCRIDAP